MAYKKNVAEIRIRAFLKKLVPANDQAMMKPTVSKLIKASADYGRQVVEKQGAVPEATLKSEIKKLDKKVTEVSNNIKADIKGTGSSNFMMHLDHLSDQLDQMKNFLKRRAAV